MEIPTNRSSGYFKVYDKMLDYWIGSGGSNCKEDAWILTNEHLEGMYRTGRMGRSIIVYVDLDSEGEIVDDEKD